MAGLADAFRARWPIQPGMADPMMPVPQMGQRPSGPPPVQQPLYTQQEPQQQGFAFPPGFLEFLRGLNQRRL